MDREILKYYIEEYKEDFDRINQDEIYKWYIVAKFQKNWDIEAVDFYNMLNKALVDYVQTPFAKVANNLICSNNFYPKSVLLEFVKKDKDTVKSMFEYLYDENISLNKRMNHFKT